MSGEVHISPKQTKPQAVGEEDSDEVCDAEPEEPLKNPQQVVEDDKDDECEW